MKRKIKLSAVFLKTKKLQLLMGSVIMLAFSNSGNAQNSSYNANTIPIGGTVNSAFGIGALSSVTTGHENVANGVNALLNNTTGFWNVANGAYALFANTTGIGNVANGYSTLLANTTGNFNVANGNYALYLNTTGHDNVANGAEALYNNTTGSYNAANGRNTLNMNTTGDNNTANGFDALYYNTIGYNNVANGGNAMKTNVSGYNNTANGEHSLYANTTGNWNTANGVNALLANTKANWNTANGANALYNNNNGDYNVANGANALYYNSSGQGNVANGAFALYSNTTGNLNTGLGNNADVSIGNLNNATALGNGAIVNTNDKTRIGDASMGVTECQLGIYTVSDGRFKTKVTEDDVKGLEFIKLLRPVVYNFDTKKFTEFLTANMPDNVRKNYLNKDFSKSTALRQTGFIAQEVEKAAHQVGYDFSGLHKPESDIDNYSIAYDHFVVPLVKAVQEQQQMIEKMQQKISDLEKTNNDLVSKTGSTTGINQLSPSGDNFSMGQNIPNPFTHETVVNYTLPQQVNNAYMAVYDLTGKQITSFPLNQKGASSMTITSEKLAAGIYIYSIIADGKIMDSKRMVVANN